MKLIFKFSIEVTLNELASFNFRWRRRSSSLSAMISCQNKIEMGIWEIVLLLPRDGVLFIIGTYFTLGAAVPAEKKSKQKWRPPYRLLFVDSMKCVLLLIEQL